MKLRPPTRHPDVVVRLKIPGDLAHALERYRAYQAETTQVEWELKDLLIALLRSVLEEGDREFLAWCKTHDPDTVPPPSRTGNGAAAPRRTVPE